MNKFRELAFGIQQDIADMNEEADELMAKREELRVRKNTIFARHREHHHEVKSGLDVLEHALNDLEGSNSKNGEGSDDSSDKFRANGAAR